MGKGSVMWKKETSLAEFMMREPGFPKTMELMLAWRQWSLMSGLPSGNSHGQSCWASPTSPPFQLLAPIMSTWRFSSAKNFSVISSCVQWHVWQLQIYGFFPTPQSSGRVIQWGPFKLISTKEHRLISFSDFLFSTFRLLTGIPLKVQG